jgi:spermidine synthase
MLPVSALAASAYAAALPVSFAWLSSGRSAFTVWFGPNIMFLILPAAAGALCGFQFPVANKMYLAGRSGAGRSAGLNYGADLAGASLGALVTGAFLIPVAGIPATCLMVSAANLAVALVLLRRL